MVGLVVAAALGVPQQAWARLWWVRTVTTVALPRVVVVLGGCSMWRR